MPSKEEFLEKYQKAPVVEFQNSVSNTPIVSVCVQTYNQEKFIGDCLDGILKQKTNFEFEILVGEDESPDNTRAVCLDYGKKYPEKIRLFLHSRENNIKVYGKPSPEFNYKYNMYHTRGKYIALCEGDDYWIDPLKLQKQVDFLEANEDYGLIYSDITLIGEEGEIKRYENFEKRYERIRRLYKSGDIFWQLLEKNLINTLTVCARRNLILDYVENFSREYSYDHSLWLHIASKSKIKFVNEPWAAYRILNQGISNSTGFFNRRTPLAKQASIIYYLNSINFNSRLVDKQKFSKVAYNIITNKHITKSEKKTIS